MLSAGRTWLTFSSNSRILAPRKGVNYRVIQAKMTTFSKPTYFSDYFTSRKAQQANDSLVHANVFILEKNRMFSTVKPLG